MSLTVEIASGSYIALPSLDVTGTPVGRQVIDAVSGNTFVLQTSSASVDHSTVEAVLGHPELRWQLQTMKPGNLSATLFKSFCSVGADASGGATHITATGVKVGDSVIMVANVTDHASAATSFEASVTVNDQIQQSATDLSAKTLVILVLAQS